MWTSGDQPLASTEPRDWEKEVVCEQNEKKSPALNSTKATAYGLVFRF